MFHFCCKTYIWFTNGCFVWFVNLSTWPQWRFLIGLWHHELLMIYERNFLAWVFVVNVINSEQGVFLHVSILCDRLWRVFNTCFVKIYNFIPFNDCVCIRYFSNVIFIRCVQGSKILLKLKYHFAAWALITLWPYSL